MEDAFKCAVTNVAFDPVSWANRVASACIERYNTLPRAGKPGPDEWAPLAGVVAFIPVSASHSVGLSENSDSHNEFGPCDEYNDSSKGQDKFKENFIKENEDITVTNTTLPSRNVLSENSVTSLNVTDKLSPALASSETVSRGVALRDGSVVIQDEAKCPLSEGVVSCVALGTGSKCLGGNELVGGGIRIHDSHAEVLARRGFLRYLLHQAERALTAGDSPVLVAGPTGCRVRSGVSFHAFVSEPPCGDAAIFPSDEHAQRAAKECSGKRQQENDDHDSPRSAKRFFRGPSKETLQFDSPLTGVDISDDTINLSKFPENIHKAIQDTVTQESNNASKYAVVAATTNIQSTSLEVTQTTTQTTRQSSTTTATLVSDDGSIASDVHRTGAKCVGAGKQDQHAPGVGYHVTGAIRTKPGRGDPTLSLSCSDKMARWHAVGIQGALLSLILPLPLRYRSVSIAGGVTWSAVSMRRALVERACTSPAPLVLAQSTLNSPAGRGDGARPCAAGVVWCDVPERPHEVVARGLKQGVTKKAASLPAGRLKICRKELAKEFVRIYSTAGDRLRLHASRSVQQTLRHDNGNLVADSQRLDLHAHDLDLNSDSDFVVADVKETGVNALHTDSLVLEGRSSNLRHQNHMNDYKRDGIVDHNVSAVNSKVVVCGNVAMIASDKSYKCLVGEETNIGSIATLGVFNVSIAGEIQPGNDLNCDQLAKNEGSVAEMLRKMTYGQLKASSCDYQHRWRHVRDSHFPGWTSKPGGLQDFIVDN